MDGFVISKTFAPCGGPEAVLKMCAECPANFSGDTVGCQIRMGFWEELGNQFSSVARELGLEEIYKREFYQESQDPWRGIWIRQPMSRSALELLAKVLDYLLNKDPDNDTRKEWKTFSKAVTFALQRSLEIKIAHGTPYNTILGTPSHCPWCKARVSPSEWDKFFSESIKCPNCNLSFPPDEDGSRPAKRHQPHQSLLTSMGEGSYRQMAEEYLQANGKTTEEAREIVSLGLQAIEQEQTRLQKYQPYLDKTLFTGLQDVSSNSKREHRLFRASEFKAVLKRCRKSKVAIRRMVHLSKDPRMQRMEEIHWILRNYIDGLTVFEKWLSQEKGIVFSAFDCDQEKRG